MDAPHPIIQALYDWWPALALVAVAYLGLRFISGASRRTPKLQGIEYDLHQITTTLACSEHQARTLLSTYNGNATKAIHDIKTGKAVLPGAEFKEIARYAGDVKSFLLDRESFGLTTRSDQQFSLDPDGPGVLVLGVVDPRGRADNQGLARADRGNTCAQLFWKSDDGWLRFLMDSARMDYFVLGDRKQNAAIRNFKLVLEDLIQSTKDALLVDSSVIPFLDELHAPLYKSLAEFDAAAKEVLETRI